MATLWVNYGIKIFLEAALNLLQHLTFKNWQHEMLIFW